MHTHERSILFPILQQPCRLKGKQTIASDMFRIEDGPLVLSVSIQLQSSEHTMQVMLGAADTVRFLEWANQHRVPIVCMVEQEENALRHRLLEEMEAQAKEQQVWLNIENGCIDLVSHESKSSNAARFQFDLDDMRSALTWLKQREGRE
jgi:hypothetical protein